MMELLVSPNFWALTVAVPGFVLWMLTRRLEAWSHVAVQLGLAVETRGHFGVGKLEGIFDGAPIRAEQLVVRTGVQAVVVTRIEIRDCGRWPGGVSIAHPASDFERQGAEDRGPLIETGDPQFDAELRLRGSAGAALAMLGRDARQLILARMRMLGKGWLLRTPDGEGELVIHLECRGRVLSSERLGDAVRALRRMAAELSLGSRDVAQALADNARDDIAPVRRRNLATLVELYEPGSAEVRDACRRALEDDNVEMRLIAASVLRVEGCDVLDAILDDEKEDADRRIRALHLRLRGRIEDVAPALVRALESPCLPLRIEVITSIRLRHWAPARERLVTLAESAADAEALAIADAFAEIGDASTEPILLRWLAAEDADLRVAAARALAKVGTAASVEDLLALAGSLMPRPALRDAAREALRAIRSRLGPVDAGRLALVDLDEDAGSLSVAEDASGRVSLDLDGRRGSAP